MASSNNSHHLQGPGATCIVSKQHEDERWAKTVISFSCASAIALVSVACQDKSHLNFPFYLICLVLLVAFFFSSLSVWARSKFPTASKVFEQMGVVAAMIAFFMGIAFSIPPNIQFVAWFMCALSFVLMIVLHLYPIIRTWLNWRKSNNFSSLIRPPILDQLGIVRV